MTLTVFLHPKAAKELRKQDRTVQDRIIKQAKELRKSPTEIGKRLEPADFWSLRVGDYRVIYRIDKEEKRVVILFIGHRNKVYDDFSKML